MTKVVILTYEVVIHKVFIIEIDTNNQKTIIVTIFNDNFKLLRLIKIFYIS